MTGLNLLTCARGAMLVALLAFTGCGGSSGGGPQAGLEDAGGAPIALTPKQSAGAQGGGVLAGKLDETELRKAVDRYRIVKQRGEGPYEFAAADLNGDGRAEAVVFFIGPDWCQKTGCSLVVFQQEQTGFKPVSHVISARPPVSVGTESSYGWRDLIVKTGGGGSPARDVRLAFAGRGYPANALLQPEPTRETLSQAQQIMAASAAVSAAAN